MSSNATEAVTMAAIVEISEDLRVDILHDFCGLCPTSVAAKPAG